MSIKQIGADQFYLDARVLRTAGNTGSGKISPGAGKMQIVDTTH